MNTEITAYIGLGSNLDDPQAQLERAFNELAQLPSCRLLQRSPLYRSKPVGPQDQPDFVNGVAALATTLTPLELLDQLQAIEQLHRRRRLRHWGPRTLDLDLLLYSDQQIQHPRLSVPHPHMTARGFVLKPLLDIAPALRLPDGRAIAQLARQVAMDDLILIKE